MTAALVFIFALVVAVSCGTDNQGNTDNVFTGFSGVVVAVVAVVIVLSFLRKKGRKS